MNIKYAIINKPNELDKLRFIKFVHDNTDSFIMNTFGHVWSGRDYWNKFPIEVATDESGKVLGLHAYTVNDKYPNTMKTYYIVTNTNYRNKGIAKILIKNAVYRYRDNITHYYVNSDVKSAGYSFFKKWLGDNYEIVNNDFNSQDIIYKEPIYNIINE